MKFVAVIDQLHIMLRHIYQNAANAGFDETELQRIELASEEALTNVIKYAYPDDNKGTIVILCSHKDAELFEIRLEDQGPPFNPFAELQTADVKTSIEERPIGGLGLLMIQTIMDHLDYKRENGTNIVIMKKNIGKVDCNR